MNLSGYYNHSSGFSPSSALSTRRLRSKRAGERGFTMVEIAICLAVIAFALVAIIGVLPLGMNVQKDNREETIIGQDATVLIGAIRNGDLGMNDLTNYVIAISNLVTTFDQNTNFIRTNVFWYTPTTSTSNNAPLTSPTDMYLTSGMRIVGLLSTPKYTLRGANSSIGFYSNSVTAWFRAMSGAVTEKYPQTDTNVLGLAFAYRVSPELDPVASPEPVSQHSLTLQTNLHELRLAFRWPLLPNGVGIGRQTYRTQVAGRVTQQSTNAVPIYFLDPQNFGTVAANP